MDDEYGIWNIYEEGSRMLFIHKQTGLKILITEISAGWVTVGQEGEYCTFHNWGEDPPVIRKISSDTDNMITEMLEKIQPEIISRAIKHLGK